MSSSTNASETAAAFVATVREAHDAMTAWYNAATPNQARHTTIRESLKQRYGTTYPAAWKDVLNWPGWNETRQAFLQDTADSATAPLNGAAVAAPISASSSTASTSTTRKRKSRWGNATADDANSTASSVTSVTTASTTNTNATTTSTTNNNISEVAQWQAELRLLNQKIDRIPTEAARVDALPRDHRERSPSPPPSTFSHLLLRDSCVVGPNAACR
jgi:hypothetical protein